MARFSPVCPSHILEALSPRASGDYHLLLAHDVAVDPGYKRFFDRLHNRIVIMDNSVIELGNAVDVGMIQKACDAVCPTTIVLPDVLLDARETYRRCSIALIKWREAFAPFLAKAPGINGSPGFMIVPQGKTIQEWAWCAECFAFEENINFWGIPRNLVAQVGTRRDAIAIARALNPSRAIHLLGFSDNIVDDVICARNPYVMGIDSAVPLRAASEGKKISMNLEIGPRGNWWKTAQHNEGMDINIELYQKWIGRT
jgi:hypothetical protein